MKNSILKIVPVLVLLLSTITVLAQKVSSQKIEVSFFSHTTIEDIKSNNYKAVSTLDESTGDLVFSVPMQSFEFEKVLMQKHFNSADFLDTKKEPKAKLVAKIANVSEVNFNKNGTYNANVNGVLTIKGVSKNIIEKAVIIVKDNTISLKSKFDIVLADYGIAFKKGKPSTNIAKRIEINVEAQY
jgi:polyisoprenoid-binding protein YceI